MKAQVIRLQKKKKKLIIEFNEYFYDLISSCVETISKINVTVMVLTETK